MQKQLATSAGAWYQSASLDDTRFGVSGTPRPNVSLAQIDDAIDGVIAEFADKGITADELERAKSRLVADTIYAQDNQATLARWFGSGMTTGSTVADILAWPDRLAIVTADQVRDAARKWLDKRRSVTGFLVKEIARPEEKRS
jgi:zinc protease